MHSNISFIMVEKMHYLNNAYGVNTLQDDKRYWEERTNKYFQYFLYVINKNERKHD